MSPPYPEGSSPVKELVQLILLPRVHAERLLLPRETPGRHIPLEALQGIQHDSAEISVLPSEGGAFS